MSEKTRRIKQLEICIEIKHKNIKGMQDAYAKLEKQIGKEINAMWDMKTELAELRRK